MGKREETINTVIHNELWRKMVEAVEAALNGRINARAAESSALRAEPQSNQALLVGNRRHRRNRARSQCRADGSPPPATGAPSRSARYLPLSVGSPPLAAGSPPWAAGSPPQVAAAPLLPPAAAPQMGKREETINTVIHDELWRKMVEAIEAALNGRINARAAESSVLRAEPQSNQALLVGNRRHRRNRARSQCRADGSPPPATGAPPRPAAAPQLPADAICLHAAAISALADAVQVTAPLLASSCPHATVVLALAAAVKSLAAACPLVATTCHCFAV